MVALISVTLTLTLHKERGVTIAETTELRLDAPVGLSVDFSRRQREVHGRAGQLEDAVDMLIEETSQGMAEAS